LAAISQGAEEGGLGAISPPRHQDISSKWRSSGASRQNHKGDGGFCLRNFQGGSEFEVPRGGAG